MPVRVAINFIRGYYPNLHYFCVEKGPTPYFLGYGLNAVLLTLYFNLADGRFY